jgi:hypothetical protein
VPAEEPDRPEIRQGGNEGSIVAIARLLVDVDEDDGVVGGDPANQPLQLVEVLVCGDDVRETHLFGRRYL